MFPALLFSAPPSLWGHQAYAEVAPDELVAIEGVKVHQEAAWPLLCLLEAARAEGIPLMIKAGFRSLAQQRQLFEEGWRRQGSTPRSYAWWTAPPGYSEHHTGLAMDFGVPDRPTAQGHPRRFLQTPAGRWLLERAPAFGFVCSFGPDQRRVAFEPWHWRYEGSPSARAVFGHPQKKNQGSWGTNR